MRTLEIGLIEWPAGPDAGGPRILGRLDDTDLVKAVQERLSAQRRRDLARIEGPVRVVSDPDPDDSEEARPPGGDGA